MSPFDESVTSWMSAPVHTVRDDARLEEVERMLRELGVSGLAVVDATGAPIGVISRTDLLRAGRMRKLDGARKRVLSLPGARVRQHMQTRLETVAPSAPLSDVAHRMVRHHVHRIYVSEDTRLCGVVSTQDVLRAVADSRALVPLADLMTSRLVTVKPEDPVTFAVDRLGDAGVSGLVVLDREWPVGLFGQIEALEARDAGPQEPVEAWMSSLVVSLPMWMPAHRAAAQALATGSRRLLAVDAMQARGLVTGTDFARLVGGAGQ